MGEYPAEPGSEPKASAEPQAQRWSADEKVRIVRESFWPGERVSDVAQRYGLSSRQSSSWRNLAREGKLTLPSLAGPEPEPVAERAPVRLSGTLDRALWMQAAAVIAAIAVITIGHVSLARPVTRLALRSDFAVLRRDLDVVLWMAVANLAITSTILALVLARLFQP